MLFDLHLNKIFEIAFMLEWKGRRCLAHYMLGHSDSFQVTDHSKTIKIFLVSCSVEGKDVRSVKMVVRKAGPYYF